MSTGRQANPPSSSHVHIPTPTWRFYTPPLPSLTPPPSLPDSHYHSLHDPLALAEREKWAPPSTTSAKNSNRLNRPRPLFPTPTESVALIHSALSDFRSHSLRQISPSDPRTPNLAILDHALKPLAQVERLLFDLRKELQQELTELSRAALMTPNIPESSRTFSLRMHAHHPVSCENIAFDFAQRTNATLRDLQETLYRNGEDVLTACREIGSNLHFKMEPNVNFCAVRERFAAERGVQEKCREKEIDFSDLIRRKIDSEKYPLFAKTFALHPDYCLDGTRRKVAEIVNQIKCNVDTDSEHDDDDDDGDDNGGDDNDDDNAVLVAAKGGTSMKPSVKQDGWEKGMQERAPMSVQEVERTRGIGKKRQRHAKSPRNKKKRKSFRVMDHDLGETPSDGRNSAMRNPIVPLRLGPVQHIVELDQDDNDGKSSTKEVKS